jgi:hypothetical protein
LTKSFFFQLLGELAEQREKKADKNKSVSRYSLNLHKMDRAGKLPGSFNFFFR